MNADRIGTKGERYWHGKEGMGTIIENTYDIPGKGAGATAEGEDSSAFIYCCAWG